jgi:hypothetical protein
MYPVTLGGLIMPLELKERVTWCDENVHFELQDIGMWGGVGTRPWTYDSGVFYFLNEKYALLFILRWL